MKQHLLVIAVAAAAATGVSAQADTLAKIKSSGSITQGVRESSGALAYTLGNGVYTGFHYDICTNIIRDIQKKLGVASLETKYQPVTSQNRIPLVKNGTVDLECGSTTNDENRQKEVAFADTLYVEEVRIAVRADSPIKSVADLDGKTVVTTTGTTSVQLLRQNKRAAGINFKEVTGKDHSDSFLLLESGRADAFVMDGQILAGNIAKSKNPKGFKIVGEPLSVEPIAIMIRKDDPEFKKVVDDSIKAQIKDGTVAKLYDKWFLKPIPPTNTAVNLPASAATKAAWANPNDKPKAAYKVD
ncbi:amino acid ABC transporter substrate-binding protein [Xylophilus sp.]|uniref:amino acid ABC transporter substrate-binding protein n=1 Tax=Xylophilus sp. TaxID=2653893 RepID=UPI0013B9B7B6|nr:amino acid ABC transporter substrate-binding protein [Xylophilus sp.]KAF1043960.1 MAG: Glutamate/aspartate import solute-binding protein [Xylophilus sp.]